MTGPSLPEGDRHLLPQGVFLRRGQQEPVTVRPASAILRPMRRARIFLTVLGAAWMSSLASAEANEPVAPPYRIPFYSGNLSVDHFRRYWGTIEHEPGEPVTDELVATLRRTGCFAMCDYPAWCLVEQQPGVWDFSLYQRNERRLREAGIAYNVFPWLHFPPKWFLERQEFVAYRDLVTGKTIPQLSLWAPATRRIYRTFYARLADAFPDRIPFIRLAMPSEYGEIGYCAGMTAWLLPQPDARAGFWCADPHAEASFREWALRRYGSLDRLNTAWGTRFAETAEVAMPDVANEAIERCRQPGETKARRRWLDFIDWYHGSWTEFMLWSANVVRDSFPGYGDPAPAKGDLRTRHDIIISLGYGQEAPQLGNDQGQYIAAMKAAGLSAQTPGAIHYFATRRVSSACAFYGVPYFTEPPGDVPRNKQVERIWMDASNGSRCFFDYLPNLDRARDLFAQYGDLLDGSRSIADVAFLLPTTTLNLHTDWQWPPAVHRIASHVRDRLNYEVLDEQMIVDGALDAFSIRILVVADAEYLRHDALGTIERWVHNGGVVAWAGNEPVRNLEGDDAVWRRLTESLGEPPSVTKAAAPRGLVGRGAVFRLDAADGNETIAVALARLHDDLADFVPDARNGVRVAAADGAGILPSRFANRLVYFNPGDEAVEAGLRFRATDFPEKAPRPRALRLDLTIPAHGIAIVALR